MFKHTGESRAKMCEAWKRRRLIPVSAETRLKQSSVSKGKSKSLAHRLAISWGKIGKLKRGTLLSEQHKQAISRANTNRIRSDMRGVKNPKWKDGRTYDIEYRRLVIRLHNQKRRALGTIHPRVWESIKARFGYMCPACALEEPDIKLTIDHIIPVSKGGTNDASNLQPLCRLCNSRKMKNVRAYVPYKTG